MSYPTYDGPMLKQALRDVLAKTRERQPQVYDVVLELRRYKELVNEIHDIAKTALDEAE